MRRGGLSAVLVALALVVGCGDGSDDSEEAAEAAADAPNFVVVMTDDQDVPSLGAMRTVQRELVDRGAEFTNSFVGLSECCPSRVSFLTGQHAHNHGVETSKPPEGGYPAMDSENTLAVWLDEAGYRTGEIGRYVNFYGNPDQGTDPKEVPPGWDEWHAPVHHTDFQVYDYVLNENGRLVEYGDSPSDYATDVFAGKAVEFIESSARREDPFFLWVTPNVPHKEGALDHVVAPPRNPRPAPRDEGSFDDIPVPEPPSFGEPDLADKPRQIRKSGRDWPANAPDATLEGEYRGRMESLAAVDRMVARIMEALRRTGELGETYVIFTSDNGYMLGEHRQTGKHLVYEESIRVPLVVRGPGVEPGAERPEPAQNIDLAPTITALASVEPGLEPDGVQLFGPGADPPRDRDLLIEYLESNVAFAAVRTADGLVYAEYENGQEEMYDLRKDPHQLENVATDPGYADTRARLARKLGELRDCAGDGCR